MISKPSVVNRLLHRGDEIAFEGGMLAIRPASGNAVPPSWLKENQEQITKELATMLGIDLVRYIGYTTGCYGNSRHSGVTLQFEWLVSGREAYVIFNANLKRARSTKAGAKGAPLPKGHFRVESRSKFIKFWARTGLQKPKRLASLHDYMGNLKPLVFSAETLDGEKLNKDSIQPLNVSASVIAERYRLLTDKEQTTGIQRTDNSQTILPDKKSSESPVEECYQPNLTTGDRSYGIRSTGNAVTRDAVITLRSRDKLPEEQTREEWLADYDGG